MADLSDVELSAADQYSETVLDSVALCLGIEGGFVALKQFGFLKSETSQPNILEHNPHDTKKVNLRRDGVVKPLLLEAIMLLGKRLT